MDYEEYKKESSRIIQQLLDALKFADEYAQERDGFTIFFCDVDNAYSEGEQFLETTLD